MRPAWLSVSLCCAAAALALCCVPAAGQLPSSPAVTAPTIVFDYSNPGLSPSHWVLTLHPDGSGHYTSETNNKVASAGDEMNLPSVNRDIRVSPKFAASIFDAALQKAWFQKDCDSHMKVAFQGWKKISYSGPDGAGSCAYNYSKDKVIQSIGDSMQAVSMTILEGVKLEMLLQHDPLGLDKEINGLVSAAHEGRAQQLCAISEILQRLAQDDHVMDMVRKQARILLAQADS